MVGEKGTVVLEEIQQMWDLLEVGRHVRVIPPKMDVVELDIDDVLDAVIELAVALFGRCAGRGAEHERRKIRKCEKNNTPHFRPPIRLAIDRCDLRRAGNLSGNCYGSG